MINLFKKDNKKLINILRITREKNIKAKPWCLKKCYFKLNKTFQKILETTQKLQKNTCVSNS